MRHRRMYARVLLCVGLSIAAAPPARADAQDFRVTGTSSVRYIELRPMLRDSVPVEDATGDGLLRQTADGRIVRCIGDDPVCRYLRAGDPVSTLPFVQDLDVSVWGFAPGLRVLTQMRVRSGWGGDRALWPRGDDAFDLLAAFAELDRERVRVRAGRQWRVSGLGFYNFDGLAVLARPGRGFSVEGYVGRSLVRGLNESRTGGALESVEALAPDDPGVVLGLQTQYRRADRFSVGVLYHMDVRVDREAVHSELAAFDAMLRSAPGTLDGTLELDVAGGQVNEAALRFRSEPIGPVAVHGQLRRYRPYFELWTIWGAFSPVGFDEAQLGITWAMPDPRIVVRGDVGMRRYGDYGTDEGTGTLRDDGWSAGASAFFNASRRWRFDAAYRLDVGFGAARNAGHAGVARQLGDAASIGLRASAFQQIYEFRLDEGTVVSLGAESTLRLMDRARLNAALAAYRHLAAGPAAASNWNQVRGSLGVQWTIGSEPALPVTGRVRP